MTTGLLPYKIHEFHEKYGPIVRLAPNEISFTNEEAWADIYEKPRGLPQLQKDQTQLYLAPGLAKSILTEPSDVAHGRMRFAFQSLFSVSSVDLLLTLQAQFRPRCCGEDPSRVGTYIA
jgi:hypothetical protein